MHVFWHETLIVFCNNGQFITAVDYANHIIRFVLWHNMAWYIMKSVVSYYGLSYHHHRRPGYRNHNITLFNAHSWQTICLPFLIEMKVKSTDTVIKMEYQTHFILKHAFIKQIHSICVLMHVRNIVALLMWLQQRWERHISCAIALQTR